MINITCHFKQIHKTFELTTIAPGDGYQAFTVVYFVPQLILCSYDLILLIYVCLHFSRLQMVLCTVYKYFVHKFEYFFLILFFNFTILYWFCHISKWICHRHTCVAHPEPSSFPPPHTIPLGRPIAPAPSIQYRASKLDWQLVSYMILYIFQCHSPKSCHPLPLPQSPKDCSIHQCLFCCLVHRVIVTIFLNSIYMR